MGTRATVEIYESKECLTQNEPLVCLYKHMDGDPDVFGLDLARVADKRIVNGIRMDSDVGETANGVGCLAASIIADLKQGIGDVYVTSEGGGEDYNYKLWPDGEGHMHITCEELNFSGYVSRFIDFVESDKENVESVFDPEDAEQYQSGNGVYPV